MTKSTLEKVNAVMGWVNVIIVGVILAMVVMAMSGCERSEAKQAEPAPTPGNLLMPEQRVNEWLWRHENSEAVCYVFHNRYAGDGGVSCFRK
jgi:Na+-transporting methylmalonyl-CoA/oxaloacetate decarboxylase gamma subunit